MYNTYTSGAGLPGNVPTMFERSRGSHFPGAPPAAFNVGPSSGAGMSIFSSTPSGELMSSASDDSLFAPAVAPVTRAYAIKSGTEEQHMWLPKGMVVQISEFHPEDIRGNDATAEAKAERAGHNLKRLLCEHCTEVSARPYTHLDGIVGVLAEATDVGKAALKLKGGYAVVTVALENAAEVYVPPDLTSILAASKKGAADHYFGPWSERMLSKAPTETITLQARTNLTKFRAATVLADWTLGDAVGIQACLHPQIYTCDIEEMDQVHTVDGTEVKLTEAESDAASQADRFVKSRWDTQAAMDGGAPAPAP